MVVILVGKSCAGKDYVLNKLTNDFNYVKIVSATTRPMREDEVNGDSYVFMSNDIFDHYNECGSFIESRSYNTIENGHNTVWKYASPKLMLNPKLDYGIILDLDGAKSFIDYYGEDVCRVIYLNTEDSIREERARKRKGFEKAEWDRRLIDDTEKFAYDNLHSFVKIYTPLLTNTEGIAEDIVSYINYEKVFSLR